MSADPIAPLTDMYQSIYGYPASQQVYNAQQNALLQQYLNALGCIPPHEPEEPQNNKLLLLLDEEV